MTITTARTLLAIIENLNSRLYMVEADGEGRGFEGNIGKLIDELRDQITTEEATAT